MRWQAASAFGLTCGLALMVACTSSAAPTATQSAPSTPTQPAKPAAAAPAAAPTVGGPVTVSGTLDAVNGRELTIATNTGQVSARLGEEARIESEGHGTLADLQPGLSVGVTGKPDGSNVTAVSIRVFPAALGTPRPGQFPMTGDNAGNLMTNSVIESFDGSTLHVTAAGQSYDIKVPANTEVLKPVPASLADLTTGARVLAVGTQAADGSFGLSSVNILGMPPR